MFKDTDEPLTFVAHGDACVMRVWKEQGSRATDLWVEPKT
jgi:hypothetical protein